MYNLKRSIVNFKLSHESLLSMNMGQKYCVKNNSHTSEPDEYLYENSINPEITLQCSSSNSRINLFYVLIIKNDSIK